MENKKILQRILVGLTAIGPGLFLIGYNIGTGSITTMAKVGAEHGMALTWSLVLSCIFTYMLMVAYGKATIVSGRTALSTIKTEIRYGTVLAVYILIALITGELLALMGIFGIVTDLIREASILLGARVWDTLLITIVLVIGLYALLWFGKYQVFEKFLIVLVILMGLCFILVFFMVKPSLSSIAARAVSITTGMWLVRSSVFNWRVSSIPSIPGIITSLTTRSGTWAMASSSPWLPSPASTTR